MDLKTLRARLGMTEAQFAKALIVPRGTVAAWEQAIQPMTRGAIANAIRLARSNDIPENEIESFEQWASKAGPDFSGEPRPWTVQEIKNLAKALSKLSREKLLADYESAYQSCKLVDGKPPTAISIQRLVASWKELRRRRFK